MDLNLDNNYKGIRDTKLLIQAIVKLFNNLEKDDGNLEFFERLEPRYHMIDYIYRILISQGLPIIDLNHTVNDESMIQFIFFAIDDYNYLMDETFNKIFLMYDHENYIIDLDTIEYINYQKIIKSYSEFIHCMEDFFINIAIQYPQFLLHDMISNKLIAGINYNIDQILGKNKNRINIKSPNKCNFNAKRILEYYSNFLITLYKKTNEKFPNKLSNIIVNDKRSFKKSNYEALSDISLFSYNSFKEITDDIQIFNKLLKEIDNNLETEDTFEKIDIPDEFSDPILQTLITDPVELPNNIIISRSTIFQHLMSSNENPFDRTELTIEILDKYNSKLEVIDRINEFKKKLEDWKKTIISKEFIKKEDDIKNKQDSEENDNSILEEEIKNLVNNTIDKAIKDIMKNK